MKQRLRERRKAVTKMGRLPTEGRHKSRRSQLEGKARNREGWKIMTVEAVCSDYSEELKRPCIEFGVVRIDSAMVVCIHSAILQLLLTRWVSYYPAG